MKLIIQAMKKHILGIFLFFCVLGWSQKKLPNVSLKNSEGSSVSTTNNFNEKDKLYVFSFWATWCAPCIQELDAINDVYEEWKTKVNVQIIAVSVDDSRTTKRVKPLVNGKAWEYEVLLDTNQDFKRSLGIANVPYLIIVKNGEIVFTQNGHAPGSESQLLEELLKLK
jgi:thiol-disulfide isomerase/thioredoxin